MLLSGSNESALTKAKLDPVQQSPRWDKVMSLNDHFSLCSTAMSKSYNSLKKDRKKKPQTQPKRPSPKKPQKKTPKTTPGKKPKTNQPTPPNPYFNELLEALSYECCSFFKWPSARDQVWNRWGRYNAQLRTACFSLHFEIEINTLNTN